MDDSRTAELRRRRREFIRSRHPDRGGDPDEFVTGLRAFAGLQEDLGPLPVVTVVKRPGWLPLIQNEDSFSGRPGHPARRFG